jgi:threonine dehydratase
MIPYEWLIQAKERLKPYIRHTPLEYDAENQLYLKWENMQVTGSFKARGALNKILTLEPWERARGLVTASAGNHGQGVALGGKIVDTPVTVFASEHASTLKLKAIRDLGAEIKLVPGGYGEAEQAGLAFALQNNKTWVSAYNDGQVIAGQGTLGLEILSNLSDETSLTWIVPVGGGGLLSGIAAGVKLSDGPGAVHRLYGVQSEASPFMHGLYYRGTQDDVIERSSIADGLAGPVEHNALTIPFVRKWADGILLVTEAEIAQAMGYAFQHYGQRIEPSAATSLAAVLTGKVTQRPAIAVITGGNIPQEIHQQLINNLSRTTLNRLESNQFSGQDNVKC